MNRAGCRCCGDVIESANRHDFQTCRCGNISVDGGDAYQRRLWRDSQPVELPSAVSLNAFKADHNVHR